MTWLVFLPGAVTVLGLVLIATAFRPAHPVLGQALAALDAIPHDESTATERGERLGAWWLRRRAVTFNEATSRALELSGRTPSRHLTMKATGLLLGLCLPTLLGVILAVVGLDPQLPLLGSLACAAFGFVLPDVLLRSRSAHLADDATDALLSYFDLVRLERLANQSATQALHAAAAVSDNPLFAQIRAALDRARLQQRAPYGELSALAGRLDLPALDDLADVLRLDDSGAALSGALAARVDELRDAQLTSLKVAANRVSERMTVFMTIPSLVFGAILLVPPLLRLVAS